MLSLSKRLASARLNGALVAHFFRWCLGCSASGNRWLAAVMRKAGW